MAQLFSIILCIVRPFERKEGNISSVYISEKITKFLQPKLYSYDSNRPPPQSLFFLLFSPPLFSNRILSLGLAQNNKNSHSQVVKGALREKLPTIYLPLQMRSQHEQPIRKTHGWGKKIKHARKKLTMLLYSYRC